MGTVVILIFVPVLVGILLILSPLLSFTPLGKFRGYYDKLSSYERGFTSIPGQNRAPMTVAFYIVSILYLVFDLEIALLIPIVPSLTNLGIAGYTPVLFFIVILTIGFILEIGSGAIKFTAAYL